MACIQGYTFELPDKPSTPHPRWVKPKRLRAGPCSQHGRHVPHLANALEMGMSSPFGLSSRWPRIVEASHYTEFNLKYTVKSYLAYTSFLCYRRLYTSYICKFISPWRQRVTASNSRDATGVMAAREELKDRHRTVNPHHSPPPGALRFPQHIR